MPARLIPTLLLVIFAALVAAGCGKDDEPQADKSGLPDGVLCIVNGDEVPVAALDRQIELMLASIKERGMDTPKTGSDDHDEIRSQITDALVEQQILRQVATERDIEVSEKDLGEREEEIKLGYRTEAEFKEAMKKEGLSESEMRERSKLSIILNKIYEQERETAKVSDAATRESYALHVDDLIRPASRKVAHIFVTDQALANRLYKQVQGGDAATFARLAGEYSLDSQTSDKGGALDVHRGEMPPAFEKVAFSLERGEVSRPVKSDVGFHIITARGPIKSPATPAYSEVRERLESQIRTTLAGEAVQKMRVDMRQDAKVKCRDGLEWDPELPASEGELGGPGDEGQTAPATPRRPGPGMQPSGPNSREQSPTAPRPGAQPSIGLGGPVAPPPTPPPNVPEGETKAPPIPSRPIADLDPNAPKVPQEKLASDRETQANKP